MAEKVTFTSVLKNRGFLNLWVNQILVQLSFNALNFTLIIWVFKLTGSNTAVSALLFAIYLPAVILGLFSGILVDLMDRKKIILAINILLSLSFFSLILLRDFYPAILFVTFIINTLGQLYAPAEASAIPLIVRKDQLVTANSIFSATLYSCFLLGFGLAGPLITHLGINIVFGLGGTLLVFASLLATIFPSIIAKADAQGKILIEALRKWNFSVIKKIGTFEILKTVDLIRGKLPVLTSIVILAGVQMVVGVLAVLIPGFLEKSLHIEATDASYVLVIPLGLGIISGGIILGKFGQKLIKRLLVGKAIVFGGFLFFLVGISPILLPVIQHLPGRPLPFFTQPSLSSVLVVGSFLLGIAMVSILVPTQTVLQQNTPDKDRGKVYSVLGVAMAGLSLIPVLLAGILADVFGVTPIFVALGAIIMFVGLFGLKPGIFFRENELSYKIREFLGLGHWEGK